MENVSLPFLIPIVVAFLAYVVLGANSESAREDPRGWRCPIESSEGESRIADKRGTDSLT